MATRKKKGPAFTSDDALVAAFAPQRRALDAQREEDDRRSFRDVRSEVTSTGSFQIPERVAAEEAKRAARAARAAAEAKAQDSQKRVEADSAHWYSGITTPLEYVLREGLSSFTDPTIGRAEARANGQAAPGPLSFINGTTANALGPSMQAIRLLPYALDSFAKDEPLDAKREDKARNDQRKAELLQATENMYGTKIPVEVAGGLAHLPSDFASMGSNAAASDYLTQIDAGVDPVNAKRHADAVGTLNAGFTYATLGGGAITREGLAPLAKRAAPRLIKALGEIVTPAAGRSSKRLLAERLGQGALGTAGIMTTYDATSQLIDHVTALNSENKKQVALAEQNLPKTASEAMRRLGQAAVTGALTHLVVGGRSDYLEIARENARTVGRIDNVVNNARRQVAEVDKAVEEARAYQEAVANGEVGAVQGPVLQRDFTSQPDLFGNEVHPNGQLVPDAPRSTVADSPLAPPTRFGLGPQVDTSSRTSKRIGKVVDRQQGTNEFTPAQQAERLRLREQQQQPETMQAAPLPEAAPEVIPEQTSLFGADQPAPRDPGLGVLSTKTRGQVEAEAIAPHLAAAEKLEAKARKDELKKATSKWEAEKRKVGADAQKNLAHLEPQERTLEIAKAMREWSDANPKPTAEGLAAQAAEARRVARETGQPVATPTTARTPKAKTDVPTLTLEQLRRLKPDATEADLQAATTTASGFDNLINNNRPEGMAQRTEGTGQAASLSDVKAELTSGHKTGGVRSLAKLMDDGNVTLVADQSLLPEGAQQIDGTIAGWFDGKRTYVVANAMEKGKVVKDMLSIAAHEVKHGVDTNGKNYRGSFANIIGDKANKQIVNKVAKLAEKGDKNAQDIIAVAKLSRPEDFEKEVAAHTINVAHDKRNAMGPIRGVVSDILSATRANTKHLVGNKDINLDDLYVLSKSLLANVAERGEQLGDGTIARDMPMTIGENHPSFKRLADTYGKYKDPADGKWKVQMSDAGAELKDAGLDVLLGGHKTVRLSNILQGASSLEGYPKLMDTKVLIDPNIKGKQGYMWGDEMYLSREWIEEAKLAPEVKEELRNAVLHEGQHIIQEREGFAKGGSWRDFLSDAQKNIVDSADFLKSRIQEELKNVPKHMATRFNDDVVTVDQLIANATERNDAKYLEAANKIKDLAAELEPLEAQAKPIVEEAFASYGRLSGEQEAQLTEATSRMLQTEMNPFPLRKDGKNTVYDLPSSIKDDTPIRTRGESQFVKQEVDGEITAVSPDGNVRSKVRPGNNPKNYDNMSQSEATRGMAMRSSKDLRAAAEDSGMSASSKVENVKDLTKKLFGFDGVLGKEFAGALHNRNFEAALFNAQAASVDKAIIHQGKLAAARKDNPLTKEEYTAKLTQAMDDLAAIPNVDVRRGLAELQARNDPDLAPMLDGMNRIANATQALIKQEVLANPNITPSRMATLKKMYDTQFAYTSRMYEAFQGEAGKKRNEAVLDTVEKARNRLAKGLGLTDHQQYYMDLWDNAANYVIENDLTIPTAENLAKKSEAGLRKLWEAWVLTEHMDDTYAQPTYSGGFDARNKFIRESLIKDGMDVNEAKREARAVLVREIENARDVSTNPEALQAKADAALKSILKLDNVNDSIVDTYSGAKADDSIMERRVEVPEPIRELLGEIKDPGLKLSLTLAKQGELLAGNKLLLNLREEGVKKGWFLPAAEAYKDPNLTHAVDGDYLNILDGYRTSPEKAAVLNTAVNFINGGGDALTRALFDARSGFGGFAGSVDSKVQTLARLKKKATVGYNPFAAVRDAAGSPITLLMNGVYNPKDMWSGLKVAGESITSSYRGGNVTYSALWEDAVRYGLAESVKFHELRTSTGDLLRSQINAENTNALWNKLTNKTKALDRGVIETRAMTDAWTRIPIWLDRVNTLSKYYEASGVKKSMSEIKKQAAEEVRGTTVTQTRIPTAFKFLETRGLTTFAPYYIGAMRAYVGNIQLGIKDLQLASKATNSEARTVMLASGVKRLMGAVAATTAVTAGAKWLAEQVNTAGMSDEDAQKKLRQIEAQKKIMFPQDRYGEVIYVGDNKKGEAMFQNISTADPYGPITDVLRVLFDDETPSDDKLQAMGSNLIDMFLSPNQGITAVGNLVFGKKAKYETKAQRMAPETTRAIELAVSGNTGISSNTVRNGFQFGSTYIPGALNSFDPRNDIDSKKNLLGYVGVLGSNMTTANVDAAAAGTAKELDTYRKETRDLANKGVMSEFDSQSLLDYVVKRVEGERELTKRLREIYEAGTVGQGRSQSEMVQLFRRKKVDANTIKAIVQGRDYASLAEIVRDPKGPLNVKSIMKWAETEAERKGEDKKEARRKANELMNKLRVLSLQSGAIQNEDGTEAEPEVNDDNNNSDS